MELVQPPAQQPNPAQETVQPQTNEEKLLNLKATGYDIMNEINRLSQIAQAINQEIAQLTPQQQASN